jgi:hypothetical protein
MINMELRKRGKERQRKVEKVDPKRVCKWSCIGKSATQLILAKLASPHGFTLMSYLQRLLSEFLMQRMQSNGQASNSIFILSDVSLRDYWFAAFSFRIRATSAKALGF